MWSNEPSAKAMARTSETMNLRRAVPFSKADPRLSEHLGGDVDRGDVGAPVGRVFQDPGILGFVPEVGLQKLLAGKPGKMCLEEPLFAFPVIPGGRGFEKLWEPKAYRVPEGFVWGLAVLSGRP
jgi:hypothetical protein